MDGKRLPEGWIWAKLEECVDILDHLRVPVNSEERKKRQGEVPYYGATGQIGWIDDYLFDEELLLLGEDGAPFFDKTKNIAYIISGKSWVNNHAHVLRAISELTSNSFLCHYLNSFDYHGYVTGTTRLKLNQSSMRKIPVSLPPLPEQRILVARVESLLERVKKAKEELDKLSEIIKKFRQSVLKQAMSGRLTADWREKHPDVEPASELLKRIQEERLRRYEKEVERAKAKGRKKPRKPRNLDVKPLDASDLSELPESWVWANLGHVLELIQYGTSVKADASPNDGVPVLRMGNIQEGVIDYQDLKYISPEKEDLEKYRLKPGDILINRTNSPELVGKSAIFDNNGFFVFASYLIRLRIVDNMNPYYINFFLNSSIARNHIAKVKHQVAGQANINSRDISQMPLSIPPLEEQKEIVRRIEKLFKFADEVEKQVREAQKQVEKISQSILAKTFKGELTADFREAVRNWKNLDVEERRKYLIALPEGEREEVLYSDEFPIEPASVLLERIKAERERQKKERKTRKGRKKQTTLF
jgi:type I restriction enzyme S subunit